VGSQFGYNVLSAKHLKDIHGEARKRHTKVARMEVDGTEFYLGDFGQIGLWFQIT